MTLMSGVLRRPALGDDVQLGMLYDVRLAQLFKGILLWKNDIVIAKQELEDHAVQKSDFAYSYSLSDARNHVALDAEGSLNLSLGIANATGSARYLNDKKSSLFEARVDITCTVIRRTRRIPQEILSSMQHECHLQNPNFTHFVAEVVEGGTGTLSFAQACTSSEGVKNTMDKLKAKLVELSVGGDSNLQFLGHSEGSFENLKISYSGAMAENVTSFDDARRVAHAMPRKLGKLRNTLSYKLLPLGMLDSTVSRVIRNVDANLVDKIARALEAGTMARVKLQDLTEQDIANIQSVFIAAETEFTGAARRLLPELRDGKCDYATKNSELQRAITLFEQRIRVAESFMDKKYKEGHILRTTVVSLLADGFENYLDQSTVQSTTSDTEVPRLLLTFGGASINRAQHPLQERIESNKIGDVSDASSDSSSDDDDDNEWFENPQTVTNVRYACTALRQQRSRALPGSAYGVIAIAKAFRPGKEKRSKTGVGDVVLDYKGKLHIVTGILPKAPATPKITIKDRTIAVTWNQRRNDSEGRIIPTTGFVLHFRPLPNAEKDGAFPHATVNEAFSEVRCHPSETTVVIDKSSSGAPLFDDSDYEVELSIDTIVGQSAWSSPVVDRIPRQLSVASRMIDFYRKNQLTLSRWSNKESWELYTSSGKKTLFLGHKVRDERLCTDKRFEGQLAIHIVDVAPEFELGITAAPIRDQDQTIVVVYSGCSGHGKSTEINAFISYLLGGDVDDFARIMVIDDRDANQAYWVTQHVTCYTIRPLSSLFEGKTLLIVDTPGYGDSRGVERDAFVTAAMAEFFKTIGHINTIIFTCRANESRTTLLSPISTYVNSLFSKDVQSCLRTIYTFSDAGAPSARKALTELHWPVENGEIEVNNAAFTIELDPKNQDQARDWWNMSVKGQFQVMQMILSRPPISTAGSASVTQARLELERECEVVEKKILRTANDAQNLIANLGALAGAVGAAPGEKILVEEDEIISEDLPYGKATTLCLDCNRTCHRICNVRDDQEKGRCSVMRGDCCGICRKGCHWSSHVNANYIIVVKKKKEWVVPEDLIKLWNTNNNTLEGALLSAIEAYLELQEELRNDIRYLAELTEKLKQTALLHDPAALIKYIELLITTARAGGAPMAQIVQLTTAKKTLLLVSEVKRRGKKATQDSQTLLDVMGAVQKEMRRRKRLGAQERAKEEEKPCTLYNDLREKLPDEILSKAPKRLKTFGLFEKGALYPENLHAVVKLVQVVLKDGGVVAAMAASV
ncbi:hypothetical protein BCR34DRAFT_605816 [Clohesyomyces aquaticus]|uniref:G domain-containing protein n=1 Tax=Clohesyomyces aquaticus TaxID=1231657 RepID=A0A1Y1YVI3_9PLEO|nr:hypothetical protein BCR34DRAFT_605816 [Clohesyomyces aquaticus]